MEAAFVLVAPYLSLRDLYALARASRGVRSIAEDEKIRALWIARNVPKFPGFRRGREGNFYIYAHDLCRALALVCELVDLPCEPWSVSYGKIQLFIAAASTTNNLDLVRDICASCNIPPEENIPCIRLLLKHGKFDELARYDERLFGTWNKTLIPERYHSCFVQLTEEGKEGYSFGGDAGPGKRALARFDHYPLGKALASIAYSTGMYSRQEIREYMAERWREDISACFSQRPIPAHIQCCLDCGEVEDNLRAEIEAGLCVTNAVEALYLAIEFLVRRNFAEFSHLARRWRHK